MKIFKLFLILLCIFTNIMYLGITSFLSIKTMVICFVATLFASIFQMIVHECGHLIGGLVSGYKLVHIQLGAIDIVSYRNNRISIFWRNTFEGQCIMIPTSKKHLHYISYNLGGVFANIVVATISALFLMFNSCWVKLISLQLLFVGIIKAVTNLFPYTNKSIPNDGYIIKTLIHNPVGQQDYKIYLLLYAAIFWGEQINPSLYQCPIRHEPNNKALLFYNAVQELLNSNVHYDSKKEDYKSV